MRGRKVAVRAGIALVIFVIAVALVGFFAVPPIARSQIEKRLGAALDRRVTVREVAFNPFTLVATVRGLSVAERDGSDPFASFDEARVDLEFRSILRRGIVAREITLAGPHVRLHRLRDGSYNVSDIVAAFSKPAPSPADAKPGRYALYNIRVTRGAVELVDDPVGVTHVARAIEIGLPFLSTLPVDIETYVTPSFSAEINGRPFSLSGRTRPFREDRETTLEFAARGLDVPFYLKYVPGALPVAVNRATLDVQATLSFRQPKNATPSVSLAGTLSLSDLSVATRAGRPLLDVARVQADVAEARWQPRSLRLSRVAIERPEAWITRAANGALDFGVAGGAPAVAARGTAAAPTPAPPVTIERFEIAGGTVRFSDRAVTPAFATTLADVAVDANDLRTTGSTPARVHASARLASGESIGLDANAALEPWSVDGTLAVRGLEPARYAPYWRDLVLFDVRSGTADVTGRFRFASAAAGGAQAVSIDVAAKDLRLRKHGEDEDVIAAGRVDVDRLDVDLAKHAWSIGRVAAENGRFALRWPKGGSVNVLELVPPGPSTAAPWSWTIDDVKLAGFRLDLVDLGTDPPARLGGSALALGLRKLASTRGSEGALTFSLKPDADSRLAARGKIGVEPAHGSLDLDFAGVPLVPLQPYFAASMDAVVTRGRAAGRLTYAWSPGTAGTHQAYRGELTLSDVEFVDAARAERLVELGTLHFGAMEGALNPTAFAAKELAASDFFAHLVVDGDGTVNLQRVFRMAPAPAGESAEDDGAAPPDEPARPAAVPADTAIANATTPATATIAEAGAPAAAPAVAIDAITLQGGSIVFEDHYVKPNYSARLLSVAGRMSGLTSIADRPADLDLAAKLDGYAPLTIRGKLQPLGTLFADITSRFDDVDLSPLTPYAGKYLGYRIEKGRLAWDLSYRIEKRKLVATHKILLDQLTLGEKVDSAEATHLPVRLAISLLKDRDGRIELELPVTGSLDNPKFRVWPIVLKILRNVLVKAATSPFSLLARLGGGGEELSRIDFPPGQDAPSPEAAKRITALAGALASRPALRLEIAGLYDGERDREGLRTRLFLRKVKAQKLADLRKKGAPAPDDVDAVEVPEAEFATWLERAYKQEKFPKPRTALGFARALPAEDMEKLMRTNLVVADEDLRQLATRRAQRVKDALLAAGVAAERVMLVESRAADPKDKVPGTRVDFALK